MLHSAPGAALLFCAIGVLALVTTGVYLWWRDCKARKPT